MPRFTIPVLFLLGAMFSASPAAADPDRDFMIIALDPGHGGSDPGAEAMGVNEADLVLSFAERLGAVLSASDAIEVVLTRQVDEHVLGVGPEPQVDLERGAGVVQCKTERQQFLQYAQKVLIASEEDSAQSRN